MIRLSLLVLAGSALGGLGRFWASIVVLRLAGPAFPWGTLLVNVAGSVVIGVVSAMTDAREHVGLQAFLMLGFCGGFTTFSSFSLQTLVLLQEGRIVAAGANAGLSVGLCLLAVTAGWMLGMAGWR